MNKDIINTNAQVPRYGGPGWKHNHVMYACLLMGGLLLFLTGCKKSFLDLSPISNANSDDFYKTEADFEVAENAAYATLYTIYAPEEAVSYSEMMSDDATMYSVAGNQADKWAIRDFKISPDNTIIYQYWQDYYKAFYQINIVLEKLEGAGLDPAFTDRAKGEMLFLRGLYYFHLVQLFGAVPLVTKPITVAESYQIPRSSQPDVYQQIITDLKWAADHLPPADKVEIVGRASKGAAQMLLGKVYLTMGDKPSALQQLQAVYQSHQYQLLPKFTDLFGPNKKNTKESIFEIQYLGGSASAPYSEYWTAYAPVNNGVITKYGGGINQVTDDFYKEFETGDNRRGATIADGYNDAKGNFVAVKFPNKWTDPTAAVDGGDELSNNNFVVLRYADLLLLLSEASGNPTYLNEVRKRAGMPLYGTSGYPSVKYPTLALAIEHERRVELGLEFHRFFDLKRTGRAVEVLRAKGKQVTKDRLLFPIPAYVITQNPKITQNSGY